jgi:protein gp37
MSDLFQDKVPAAFVARVWTVMADTPHHTYQILTKRPDRMFEVIRDHELPTLPNVWLGTSVESGAATAVILETGARTYFGSMAGSMASR